MKLEHDICYRALRTRDLRFDGRFFTGVTSTGVYCRPICPARTPQAKHCTFFSIAAAAEDAGFRPCRRCRPETAPGSAAWRGTSSSVSRALRLIEEGALDHSTVENLAGRLGLGERHLRRLFAEHLGTTPRALAQTRRVHFAKQMIEETDLPMGRIALAAGFQNTRRFNAAVKKTFHRTPTEIRSFAGQTFGQGPVGRLTLRLPYRQPFNWPALLQWLQPRAIPGVESINDEVYRRTMSRESFVGIIEVSKTLGQSALSLQVPVGAAPFLMELRTRIRHIFDLDADPHLIFSQLGLDPRLNPLVKTHPGLRVPGCWDSFELAVRAILGQQISVKGATNLAGKFVRAFGTSIESDHQPLTHLFPSPEIIMKADVASIGMPATRARSIEILAAALCEQPSLLDSAPNLEAALQRLTQLPGIGDWTAQYIAMRAMREPDAFPAGDLGLRTALANPENGERPSLKAMKTRSEVWRPWRSYAALLLWRSLSSPTLKD